jgi:small subunit ribosomal protein S16e
MSRAERAARRGRAGSPLELLQPETLRWKVMEPVNLLGKEKFAAVDIRLRVKGGGHVSQAYGAWGSGSRVRVKVLEPAQDRAGVVRCVSRVCSLC